MNFAVPIMIHGDAVPCISIGHAGTKSFDVQSWQGVLCLEATLKAKVYRYVIFEANKTEDAEQSTMFGIWKRLLWSLSVGSSGVWPGHNDDGVPLNPGSFEGTRAVGSLRAGTLLYHGR